MSETVKCTHTKTPQQTVCWDCFVEWIWVSTDDKKGTENEND